MHFITRGIIYHFQTYNDTIILIILRTWNKLCWIDEANCARSMREIPDHATFREKKDTLGWLDKLGIFLSLALYNLTNFDQQYLPRNRNYHLS